MSKFFDRGAWVAILVLSFCLVFGRPNDASAEVQYVKICSLYGAGFFYIPGTDTCIKLGGYLRTDNFYAGATGSYTERPVPAAAVNLRARSLDYDARQQACSQGFIQWAGFGIGRAEALPQSKNCILLNGDLTFQVYAPGRPPIVPNGGSGWSFAFETGWTGSHYSSSYSRTGIESPALPGSSTSGAEIFGVVRYTAQLGNGLSATIGVDVGGDTTGKSVLFDLSEHPRGGHVVASVTPGAIVEPFAEFRGGIGNGLYLWGGPGLVFQDRKLDLTSDQTGAGGRLEWASNSTWTLGYSLKGGISKEVCPNCIFGQPLIMGVGGSVTWFPDSQSVDLRSSSFNFIERASIDNATRYSAFVRFATPLNLNSPYRRW